MALKVFILGITGYIGGTAAASIIRRNPDWEVTATVRTEEQCYQVKTAFPNIRTVVGDLNNEDVLSAESAKADIVINCANADHPGAVKSILKGLNERTASSPGYYIHTSGTGILIDLTTADGEWGNKQEERVLSDVTDIKDILGLPASNLHVEVDNIVRGASNDKVKTAIVTPPLIYGKGTGPIKTRSVQAPDLVKYALKRSPPKAFVIGQGKAIWNNVHVADIGEAFALLAETAANGGGSVKWGPEAFFFCENGYHEWIDLSKEIARVGHEKGYFQTAEVDSLTKADLVKEFPDYHYGPLLWGSNSRGKADRFRKLGWKPTHPALFETIPELFESEAKALGK